MSNNNNLPDLVIMCLVTIVKSTPAIIRAWREVREPEYKDDKQTKPRQSGSEKMLNKPLIWNQIQGNWKQLSGNVKQRWGQLTDDDLTQINGSREQLADMIQQRYGMSQAEANQQIDAWANQLKF